MPDAEPLAGATSADRARSVASEVVDLTDTAPDDPAPPATRRRAGRRDGPTDPVPVVDRAAAGRPPRPPPQGGRHRVHHGGGAGRGGGDADPQSVLRRSHDRGARGLARAPVRGPAHRRGHPRHERLHAGRGRRRAPARARSVDRGRDGHEGPAVDARDRHPRAHRGRRRGVGRRPASGRRRRSAPRGRAARATRPGMPSIVIAERKAWSRRLEAVGGAARAIAAMAPTLRRRIDGVSILADGQLRVDLSLGREVAYGDAAELSGEGDGAASVAGLRGGARARPSSLPTSGCRRRPTAVLSRWGGRWLRERIVRCHPTAQRDARADA